MSECLFIEKSFLDHLHALDREVMDRTAMHHFAAHLPLAGRAVTKYTMARVGVTYTEE